MRPKVPFNGDLANSADAGWSLAEALSAKLDGVEAWIAKTIETYGSPK